MPRRRRHSPSAPATRPATSLWGSGFTYGTSGGCAIEVVDWHTGQRRAPTKAELEAITRMQDCLRSISFWWPTVSAGHCGETAQNHQIEAAWNNTSNHLMGMVQGAALAKAAVEMATVVAGGGRAPPPAGDE